MVETQQHVLLALLGHLNWAAIAVATLAYFLLGAVWYAQPVFGRRWMRAVGIGEDGPDSDGMGRIFALSFAATAVAVWALAMLWTMLDVGDVRTGTSLGVVCGIGFAAMTKGTNDLFLRRSLDAFLVEAGYHVVGLTMAGAILGAWR